VKVGVFMALILTKLTDQIEILTDIKQKQKHANCSLIKNNNMRSK